MTSPDQRYPRRTLRHPPRRWPVWLNQVLLVALCLAWPAFMIWLVLS